MDVARDQHHRDRHQQKDHVLGVEEDARDADAEQHCAERQVVAERKPLREQFHHLPSPPASSAGVGASGAGRLASIFTMRKRSPARTLACALGTWCLVPSRLRRVSVTAAITATRSEEHTSELQSLMRISYAV